MRLQPAARQTLERVLVATLIDDDTADDRIVTNDDGTQLPLTVRDDTYADTRQIVLSTAPKYTVLFVEILEAVVDLNELLLEPWEITHSGDDVILEIRITAKQEQPSCGS